MSFDIEERPSDSPFVQMVWRTESPGARTMNSVAVSHWLLVLTRQHGKIRFTIRGPETYATDVPIPPDAEFFGIVFKLGAFMPRLSPAALIDRERDLPLTSGRSFWLADSTWELPSFDNADTFVTRLVRKGMLVFDRDVSDAIRGHRPKLSARQLRRHFTRATGLTPSQVVQIGRAREATLALRRGEPILDAVHRLGYFDQPHMTRLLKRLVGQTPAQIRRMSSPKPMSLLYKTDYPR